MASTSSSSTACAHCIFRAGEIQTFTYVDPRPSVPTQSGVQQTVVIELDSISVVFTTATATIDGSTLTTVAAVTTLTNTGSASTSVSVPSYLTWTTFGTTLTWPTTYLYYETLEGAAAVGTGCAPSSLTVLTKPSAIPQASYIFAQDSAGALPAALLSQLNSQPDFIAQLANHSLGTCASAYIDTGMNVISSSSTSVITSASSSTISSIFTSATTSSSYTGNGLTPGQSAGIGVGVSTGILLLIGLVALTVLRYWRRKRLAHDTSIDDASEKLANRHEFGAGLDADRFELTPDGVAEADPRAARLPELRASKVAHELDGRNRAQELP